MSPTILTPGAVAVKSRATRSGITPVSPPAVRLCRHGRGWHATRPAARINPRTSSRLHRWPHRVSWACTRRWP
jgi:hypothetical protein